VVIHDFYHAWTLVAFRPREANPPLVVDADAVLALAMSFQCFETITWEAAQGLQMRGGFQPVEAFLCLPAETLEGRDVLAFGKFARPLVSIAEYTPLTR
jgi:hypothetical protein